MPQTIARTYTSQETAEAVVKDLREHGFSDADIHVIGRPQAQEAATQETATTDPTASVDAIRESILQTGVDPAHASIYAERVAHNEVLVTILPHFGLGFTATNILDSHDPVAVDLPESAPPAAAAWDPAAPLSSALGLRVLLSDPAPLSRYFNRPVLKPEPAESKTRDKIRQQSRDAAPLSDKLGYRTLLDNPTPLSSRFGWRRLLEKAAPLSEKFGWRVLLDDPAPLSSKLSWRVLLNDPAPLSRKLGWRVLLNDPAPLSRKLGWRVSSRDQD